eukprot:scaffold4475_cov277-Chaetoceros_neogracile.AAC.12
MVRNDASSSPSSPVGRGDVEMASLVNEKSRTSTMINTVRSRTSSYLGQNKKVPACILAIVAVGLLFSGE